MGSLKRRLRSLLIALAVLALSAGVALAGRGSHPIATSQPTGPTAQNETRRGRCRREPRRRSPRHRSPRRPTRNAG